MNTYPLIADRLCKSFGGQKVLRGASLRLEPGKIYALCGDNGCGKSVLIKCLCGLLPLDAGSVTLLGQPVRAGARLASPPGVLIEHPGFIESLSAYDNLRYLASIRGLIGKQGLLAALALVGLEGAGKKPVRSFSLGMRQRLAIAQAIMEDPELLLLDEPFNGLDAQARERVSGLLLGFRARGRTVLAVSHHPQDLEALQDCRLLLKDGQIIPFSDKEAPQ